MAIGIGFKVKISFTSKAVLSRSDRAPERVLKRFGSFVRRTAKQSMKKPTKAKKSGEVKRDRKGKFLKQKVTLDTSRPGQPPKSRTGFLKRGILFGYDRSRRSVVVGPVRIFSKQSGAPRVLEEGGVGRGGRRGKTFPIRVAKRPYMGPALRKELPKLPGLWKDSVKP